MCGLHVYTHACVWNYMEKIQRNYRNTEKSIIPIIAGLNMEESDVQLRTEEKWEKGKDS